MTPITNRQRSAEVAAMRVLEMRYGANCLEVAETRIPELLHLASLIRAQTDHLDPETCGQQAMTAAVLRAIDTYTAEF
jgi:hypothetical protein